MKILAVLYVLEDLEGKLVQELQRHVHRRRRVAGAFQADVCGGGGPQEHGPVRVADDV
ncbi:MAG: hypothetical protein HZA22_04875 [Nitrospirae bacterium]|nr:hypothetical protein [Nitrospirota bacterium]MBI5694133.1 hypothetical protein [Nitrospirota bacterium]